MFIIMKKKLLQYSKIFFCVRFTDEISDLKEKRPHRESHTVVGRYIFKLEPYLFVIKTILLFDWIKETLFSIDEMEKKYNSVQKVVTPSWYSDWSMINLDSQSNATSSAA